MIADSDCHYCGGPVGSHSDLCLDCGKDQPMPLSAKLLVAGFIALCCLIACAAGCEKPSVAEREPGVFDFEPTRGVSPALMRLAKERAEYNATAGTPKAHTDLSKYVRYHGVMAENVGTATSWDFMYHTWRNSYEHNNNINAKNLHWYGFCVCTSPTTGQRCYVVIYSSRRSALDYED
jgi:hypothetical protein